MGFATTGMAQRITPVEQVTPIDSVSIPGGLSLKHSPDWNLLPPRLDGMRELVRARFDGQQANNPDARIKVTFEQRRSHEEAVGRVGQIAAGIGAGADTFAVVGGWPGLQFAREVQRQQPNRDRRFKSDTVLRVTTAFAVGDVLIRIEAILPPDAPKDIVDEAKRISMSVVLATTGDPDQTRAEISRLRQDAAQRPVPQQAVPVPGVAPAAPASVEEPGPGVNQRIFNGGNGELEIALSPDGQFVVVGRQGSWVTSTDGGQTFGPEGVVGAFDGGDPSLAYGASGSFYYAGIDRGCQPVDAAGPLGYACTGMTRSDDNGATFPLVTPAVVCPNRAQAPNPPIPGECFPDQEHIAADRWNPAPGGDQVYSTWRNFDTTDQDPGIVCTQDSGQTWTAPVDVATGAFPRINVGSDGFVYVAYLDGGNHMLHKYSSCASGLVPQAGFPVAVASRTAVTCPFPGHDRCDQNPTSQMVAIDDTNPNHIYFAYGQSSGATNDDIIVRDSLDGGLTWPAARVVQVNAAVTSARIMPWICTTGGTAYVSWYDRRNATVANNDLTEYWGGSAGLDGSNNLVAGADFLISAVPDAWCASGWPCGGGRSPNDSERCSVQPQLSGTCCDNTQTGCPGSQIRCDFSQASAADNICPVGETCNPGNGCPKYGDYNGNACMLGRFYAGWASASTPPGVPGSGAINILFDSLTVQNEPPVAACKSFSDVADGDCCITVIVTDIDNGSMDPNGPGDVDTLCITAVDGQDVGCVQSTQVCDDGSFNPHPVTLTITDLQGAADSCDASVDVNDDTNPTSVCDAVGGVVDDNCEYVLPFSATIQDNCCLDIADVSVNVSLLTGNATLGSPDIQMQRSTDGRRIDVTGTVSVSNLTSCPATVRVTVDALDCWGNHAEQCVAEADVNDVTPPLITCPPPVTLARGDKLCNDQAQEWLDSVTAVDNCAAVGQTVASGYLGLPIPDDDPVGVSHTMAAPFDVPIGLVQLGLRIDHTRVGDLVVEVEHLGVFVTVVNQPGDSTDTPGSPFGCGANNYDITLADTGALPIESACQDDLSSPPTYAGNNPLSAFNGLSTAGAWTITVTDTAGGETGSLVAWSLQLNGGLSLTNDAPECGFPAGQTTTVEFAATDGCNNSSTCETEITIEPYHRVDASQKGSLVVFPSVELRWHDGHLVQDTFLSVTNDYVDDVYIQFVFVNGDDDAPAVSVGNPPTIVERAHAGWTKQDWISRWTADESNYFSLATGLPKGAPSFSGLDFGPEGPGRPGGDASGDRVLRGFVVAWAVDNQGREIGWNHLEGIATVIDYAERTAWEYEAYSYGTACLETGEEPLDCTSRDANGTCCTAESIPGNLVTDGFQYDIGFARLLLDFFASGATSFSRVPTPAVMTETDLTLLPVLQDLRQDSTGPVHTKAVVDVWNSNEDFLSHTDRCIWCWDQVLLSDFGAPNNFLIDQLHTDKGEARIDGVASDTVCDAPNCCPRGDGACIAYFEFWNNGLTAPVCSEPAQLLGVATKILAFSGAAVGTAQSGVTLTGQGEESGYIMLDLQSNPEQAQSPRTGRASRTGVQREIDGK